ncbi:MAG: sensor histidine kinase [Novosphingobium sp.]|uniref:sensor histidine kinase n=1 Tax=Novosphingobium sp. TaxID=1874826 RepID=UPI002733ED03|nr:sensor histidine kinase [Novosphingobium sp.]MDP3551953.1 sensor histidine kinase [Novosphingobium sp.]
MTTNIAANSSGRFSAIAKEEMILQLFAPVSPIGSKVNASPPDYGSLWRADAIHRAKNMAQLTASLATLAEDPSRDWLSRDVVVKTRSLARAYHELGTDCGSTELVPCVPLLSAIVTHLAEIFGSARQITVSIDADKVLLVPDMRRALILICSELVINALKYGYPGATGGTICVTLKQLDAGLSLVVENDGVDFTSDSTANQGSALLERLGAVLGASIERGSDRQGHGYRVGATVDAGQTLQATGFGSPSTSAGSAKMVHQRSMRHA